MKKIHLISLFFFSIASVLVWQNSYALQPEEVQKWLISRPEKFLNGKQFEVSLIPENLNGCKNLGVFFVDTKSAGSNETNQYVVKATSSCTEFEKVSQLNISAEDVLNGSPKLVKILLWEQVGPLCLGLLERAPGKPFVQVRYWASNGAAYGKALGRLHWIHKMAHRDLNGDNFFYDAATNQVVLIDNASMSTIDPNTYYDLPSEFKDLLNAQGHGAGNKVSGGEVGSREPLYLPFLKNLVSQAFEDVSQFVAQLIQNPESVESKQNLHKLLHLMEMEFEKFNFDSKKIEMLSTVQAIESYFNFDQQFFSEYSLWSNPEIGTIKDTKKAIIGNCKGFISAIGIKIFGLEFNHIPSELKSKLSELMASQIEKIYPSVGKCIKGDF